MRWDWGRWAPLVGWCALIFACSHTPDLDARSLGAWAQWLLPYDYPLRKLAHLLVYAVLFRLARRAFGRPGAAFAFAVLYAVSDEWHQSFIPGRDGSWRDVVVDGCGAALAWALKRPVKSL